MWYNSTNTDIQTLHGSIVGLYASNVSVNGPPHVHFFLPYYFCMIIEGSGSKAVPLSNESGSREPKTIRIRIRNTDTTLLLAAKKLNNDKWQKNQLPVNHRLPWEKQSFWRSWQYWARDLLQMSPCRARDSFPSCSYSATTLTFSCCYIFCSEEFKK